MKSNETASEGPENEPKAAKVPSPSSVEVGSEVIDQLPQVETISKS